MALIPRKRMASDLLDPEPREGSYNGVTSDGVFKGTSKAIGNMLDDGSASESIVVAVPSSQSGDYVVGNYYGVHGKVARLRTKTDGDNVTQLTFDTVSGVLAAINGSTGKVTIFEAGRRFTNFPTFTQIKAEIAKGKTVVIKTSDDEMWYLIRSNSAYCWFQGASEWFIIRVDDSNNWTTPYQYDNSLNSQSYNAVQNRVLWDAIGDVETLLAAL